MWDAWILARRDEPAVSAPRTDGDGRCSRPRAPGSNHATTPRRQCVAEARWRIPGAAAVSAAAAGFRYHRELEAEDMLNEAMDMVDEERHEKEKEINAERT